MSFGWLLANPSEPLAQPVQTPLLRVAEDLVIQENQVASGIAIEVLNLANVAGLELTYISQTPTLLPNENLSVSGTGPRWLLKVIPGLNQRGEGRLQVTVKGPDNLLLTQTMPISVVGSIPSIVEHPPSLTIHTGETAEFSIEARGSEPLSYQWQFNNQNLSGSTGRSLRFANVAADQIGNYRVLVSNPFGVVTSESAHLEVIAAPVIGAHPQSQSVPEGVPVVFSVNPVGQGPFAYQWRRNGINLPSETRSILTLPSPKPSSAGIYSVVVKGPFGAVTSNPATLTVEAPVFILSDRFEERPTLPGDNGTFRAASGDASAQVDEPDHAGKKPGASVWARWTAPTDGVMRLDTAGSSFDTVLAAYTGSTLDSLQDEASDDDQAGFFTSAIRFSVVKGKEYQIVVDGLAGAAGTLLLSWTFEAGAPPVPRIVRDPVSRVVQPGNFTLVDVVAVGVQSYQWELNASDVPGGVSPLWRVRSAKPSDAGNYQVKLSNGRETVFSQMASIQLGPDPKVASKDKFRDQILLGEPVAPLSFNKAGLSSLTHWKQGGAAAASGFRGTQVFNSVGSTTEDGEPNLCGIIGGASQWFTYECPADGTLVVSTEGSSFDTLLGVFTGPGNSFESLVLIACDNDGGTDRKTSRTRLKATKGTSYYVAVDGVNGASGNVHLTYTLSAPARVVSTKLRDNQVHWEMSGMAGVAYKIQASVNLAAWETIGTTNSPTGTINFSESRTSQKRFYRVIEGL